MEITAQQNLAEMYGWFAVNHYDLVCAMSAKGLSDDMCAVLADELRRFANNESYTAIKMLCA